MKSTGVIQLCVPGMNAAVRATVRVGLYTGAKVYFVHEVQASACPGITLPTGPLS